MTSEVFESTQQKDDELTNEINILKERIKAYPDDKDSHESLVKLYVEAKKLWESCESQLKELDSASQDKEEKVQLVKEINISKEMIELYKSECGAAIKNELENTSKAYQFFDGMSKTGKSMQNTGKAMKSTGDSMTVGCTIPIIIIVILLLLFIIIL